MIITETENCAGCGLCENICPANAIDMQPDSEFGHLRPFVVEKKCIDCNLCKKMCPSNSALQVNDIKQTYAAWHKDDVKHCSSSSGGIASAIYEHTLKKNGWIAGVYVDESLQPKYKLSNDIKDIDLFKGSKYVQVSTDDIYSQIQEKINNGDFVTFIGLPCHCSAVKQIVGSNCEKLLLVDLVCHGIPSFKSLQGHIKRVLKNKTSSVTNVSFRDSKAGEVLSLFNKNKIFYNKRLHEDEYMHAFITGNFFAESCYNCKYAQQKRLGDMTIGDFWGIGKYEPFEHKISRVSEVLINTERGNSFFDELKDVLHFEKRPTLEALEGNDQLNKPSLIGSDREYLLEQAKKGNLEQALVSMYSKTAKAKYSKRIAKEFASKILTVVGVKKVVLKIINKNV